MSKDYTGLALVVTAIMGPLVAVFTLYFNNRTVKKVHEVATKTLEVATQVDAAVNGKGPGEASISEDITTILAKQEADSPTLPVVEIATLPVVTKKNGDAPLRLQVAYLTKLVEDMVGKRAKPKPTARRR